MKASIFIMIIAGRKIFLYVILRSIDIKYISAQNNVITDANEKKRTLLKPSKK